MFARQPKRYNGLAVNPPSPSLADVVVALPVYGTFSYRVPEELADGLTPGSRVLVPFGRRQVTGYVLGTGLEPAAFQPEYALRSISRLLDAEPLFGPGLLALMRFAADYYHYPLGLTIAEALPAGLKAMSLRAAVATEEGLRALADDEARGEEARLLERLTRSGGLTLARLARQEGGLAPRLRRLEAKGWVRMESRFSEDRVRSRRERWLFPLSGGADGPPPPVRLGPREQALLGRLEKSGPVPVGNLRADFPSLDGLIRRLRDKGVLKVEEREVYRDSAGRALTFDAAPPQLTEEQVQAVARVDQALKKGRFAPFLLHGVTGSGKTEVYLRAAESTLAQGRTALILVPEISLTPAMEGQLRARFQEEVAVLHSGLAEGERYDQWLKIRRGQARLVLGARSAVFAPLEAPGLIVVDEEHDGAYKQEDGLRYQARDLAVVRARQAKGVVLLGSATPSLESFDNARTGRYELLSLTRRIGADRLPRVQLVDLRLGGRRARGGLTPMLKEALSACLEQGEQALLFLNRRGLAPLPMCLSCGHVIKCQNCSVSLTLHQGEEGVEGEHRLVCHYCGFTLPQPRRCPACGSRAFRFLGLGTERLEAEIKRLFPEARVGRLDADSTRIKGSLSRILNALRERRLDVLLGTQMVTKGHDFPGITLVGVIEADLGLHLPDFRAGERTFQLLAQVAGRAGRGGQRGRVIIQTLSPGHYSLVKARSHDFLGFFEEELAQRRRLMYPPFSRLALLRFQGGSEDATRAAAEEVARKAAELLKGLGHPWLEVIGPAPAPRARVKRQYRFQILVRSEQVRPLHDFLRSLLSETPALLKKKKVTFSLDVDPYHLL